MSALAQNAGAASFLGMLRMTSNEDQHMAFWQAMKTRVARLGGVVLLTAASTSAMAGSVLPTVSASATGPAVAGSTVSVDVLVSGIADLYAFQFSLGFNPAVLQATGVTEGAFLPTGGGTTFDDGTTNNTLGQVALVFDSLSGFVSGVSGNGQLARISFNVIAVGTSPLTFSDVVFLNSALGDITVTAQNGILQAVPEPQAALLMVLGLAGLLAQRRRAASIKS